MAQSKQGMPEILTALFSDPIIRNNVLKIGYLICSNFNKSSGIQNHFHKANMVFCGIAWSFFTLSLLQAKARKKAIHPIYIHIYILRVKTQPNLITKSCLQRPMGCFYEGR